MRAQKAQPNCLLFHQLINKLAVIIGSCDLAQELVRPVQPSDSPCLERLEVIHSVANDMVEELKRHSCELTTTEKTILLCDAFSHFKTAESKEA